MWFNQAHHEVIAVTAKVMAADVERARMIGFNEFIGQPIDPLRLVGQVTRTCGETRSGSHGKGRTAYRAGYRKKQAAIRAAWFNRRTVVSGIA
jgi:CheY-like chemotaxis protein